MSQPFHGELGALQPDPSPLIIPMSTNLCKVVLKLFNIILSTTKVVDSVNTFYRSVIDISSDRLSLIRFFFVPLIRCTLYLPTYIKEFI